MVALGTLVLTGSATAKASAIAQAVLALTGAALATSPNDGTPVRDARLTLTTQPGRLALTTQMGGLTLTTQTGRMEITT